MTAANRHYSRKFWKGSPPTIFARAYTNAVIGIRRNRGRRRPGFTPGGPLEKVDTESLTQLMEKGVDGLSSPRSASTCDGSDRSRNSDGVALEVARRSKAEADLRTNRTVRPRPHEGHADFRRLRRRNFSPKQRPRHHAENMASS